MVTRHLLGREAGREGSRQAAREGSGTLQICPFATEGTGREVELCKFVLLLLSIEEKEGEVSKSCSFATVDSCY